MNLVFDLGKYHFVSELMCLKSKNIFVLENHTFCINKTSKTLSYFVSPLLCLIVF